MAIIKCPECGHPVSDKAPTCPNCGVEIAGKVNLNIPQQNIKENINTPKSETKTKEGNKQSPCRKFCNCFDNMWWCILFLSRCTIK